jgi:hypothetical protein
MFDESTIERMTGCEKRIVYAQREYREERGQRRRDFELVSEDGSKFSMFIRQNLAFAENFSVGLDLLADGGRRITLVRMNGRHGEYMFGDPMNPHYGPHIHIADPNAVAQGIREERRISATDEFTTLGEAIAFFVIKCGVVNAGEHIKDFHQMSLEEGL